MKLSQISDITKFVLPIFFIAVILSLSTIIIFQFTKPKPPPKVDFSALSGKASSFSLSKKLEANYPKKISLVNFSIPHLENSFPARLGFKSEPQATDDSIKGKGEIYKEGTKVLFIYDNEISFLETHPALKGQIFPAERIENTAQNFVNATFQNANELIKLKTEKPNNTYQPIEIYYTNTIEDIPVYSPTLKLEYSQNGNLISFLYRPVGTSTSSKSYRIIDPKKAYALLTKGRGYLISITGDPLNIEDARNLGEVKLEDFYLAYYYNPDKKSDYLQPVWLFEGESIVLDRPAREVFAVPAVY